MTNRWCCVFNRRLSWSTFGCFDSKCSHVVFRNGGWWTTNDVVSWLLFNYRCITHFVFHFDSHWLIISRIFCNFFTNGNVLWELRFQIGRLQPETLWLLHFYLTFCYVQTILFKLFYSDNSPAYSLKRSLSFFSHLCIFLVRFFISWIIFQPVLQILMTLSYMAFRIFIRFSQAPEIDILEAMGGSSEALPNTNVTKPYFSSSLQVLYVRSCIMCSSNESLHAMRLIVNGEGRGGDGMW